MDQVIDDDILRLIFTACHPVLTLEARTALTLRLICGLTTAEIARAFLVGTPLLVYRHYLAIKEHRLHPEPCHFSCDGRIELCCVFEVA